MRRCFIGEVFIELTLCKNTWAKKVYTYEYTQYKYNVQIGDPANYCLRVPVRNPFDKTAASAEFSSKL